MSGPAEDCGAAGSPDWAWAGTASATAGFPSDAGEIAPETAVTLPCSASGGTGRAKAGTDKNATAAKQARVKGAVCMAIRTI